MRERADERRHMKARTRLVGFTLRTPWIVLSATRKHVEAWRARERWAFTWERQWSGAPAEGERSAE